jgi:hypothetical protein
MYGGPLLVWRDRRGAIVIAHRSSNRNRTQSRSAETPAFSASVMPASSPITRPGYQPQKQNPPPNRNVSRSVTESHLARLQLTDRSRKFVLHACGRMLSRAVEHRLVCRQRRNQNSLKIQTRKRPACERHHSIQSTAVAQVPFGGDGHTRWWPVFARSQ